MHQQHRRQILTQDLQIAKIADASLLALAGALDGTRQCGEDDSSVLRLLLHQLVENEMLRPAREVVEAERYGLLEWKAAR